MGERRRRGVVPGKIAAPFQLDHRWGLVCGEELRCWAPGQSILSPSPALVHAHGAVISVCQMAAHSYTWLTEGLALPRVNAPRQPRETEARIRAVTCWGSTNAAF